MFMSIEFMELLISTIYGPIIEALVNIYITVRHDSQYYSMFDVFIKNLKAN